jgi:hypothetical protein
MHLSRLARMSRAIGCHALLLFSFFQPLILREGDTQKAQLITVSKPVSILKYRTLAYKQYLIGTLFYKKLSNNYKFQLFGS